MSKLINLSRHKELTAIFVSQESRSIDKNIASAANVIIFKNQEYYNRSSNVLN